MTDDFRPGPEFPRWVDQRTGQLRRRRHLFVAGAATAVVAIAVALPLALTSGNTRSTVKVLASPTTLLVTTAPPGIQAITYEPFTAQGAIDSGLHVTKVANGACNSSGVAGNSSYRCFSGSNIYDPCFAKPGATSGPVVCPANPSTPDVIQLNAGSLPPPLPGPPQQRAWAIQLADDQVCIQVNAAWGGLGPFRCQPSPPGPLADCHVPNQIDPQWKAECQTQLNASSPFTTYRVVTAWL